MRSIFYILIAFVAFNMQAQELIWHTDLTKAINISKAEKKPVMLFFTGSDWCGWCIRLQKEVFNTPEFIKWSNENVVLVELDYPKRKELSPELKQQNLQMKQMFQIKGYPTVWIVQPEENEGKINFKQLGKTGYVAGGPEKWIAAIQPAFKNAK
jgi:protein disulfide-isomerase